MIAAGGACGDTIRFSLATDGERDQAAGFDADGCGASTAAASAAVTLVRGRSLLQAARIGHGRDRRGARRAQPGQAARRRGRGRRARAGAGRRSPQARRPAGTAAAPRRSAPSWRCPAASTAPWRRCCARATARSVAVTLELWADRENDGERSCCSASARRPGARARASARPAHISRSICARPFRDGVVTPFIAGPRRRRDAEPVRALQRQRPARRHAGRWRTGSERRRLRPATTRASAERDRTGRCCASPRIPTRIRHTCSAALAPASLARLRFPLGELTKPQVRELARDAGLPVAGKPDSQDLCFLAGTDRARFLERHGGIARRGGEIVDRSGAVTRAPRRPGGLHGRPAPRDRRRRAGAAVRARPRRASQPRGRRTA